MDKYNFTKEIINNLIGNVKCNNSDDYVEKKYIKPEISKNILVIITDNNNMNNTLMKLLKLRNEGLEIDLILSNKVKELVDIEMINLRLRPRNIYMNWKDISDKDITKEIDIGIVPTMTQNDIVKLSLGIQDDISSSIMWKILWENKSLFIDMTNIVKRKDSGKNEYLNNMMDEYINKVENMGVKKIISSNYANEIITELDVDNEKIVSENTIVEGSYKKVITEKDILQMNTNNKSLIISKNTIITPLAYDTARKKEIEIIRK